MARMRQENLPELSTNFGSASQSKERTQNIPLLIKNKWEVESSVQKAVAIGTSSGNSKTPDTTIL